MVPFNDLYSGPDTFSEFISASHSAVPFRGPPLLLPPLRWGPVGARGIHGRHEPIHHPQCKRPRARGRRAHPFGVRARSPEVALSLAARWVLDVGFDHLADGNGLSQSAPFFCPPHVTEMLL
uniref:cDNA FLJ59668 n=1 Tax=Homo sapiens TaxID=9606 RepID=B4DEI1_HUMAN|nr:unnamed protein product [Homo sapiens]